MLHVNSRTCALAILGLAGAAQAAVPATLVVKQGDVFGTRTVSTLNAPFTDGNGKVGFVASFDDSTRGIWHDTGFVFNSSNALPDTLTGGESTMGVSNSGGFVYSPSFNGNDSVYTHAGKLLAAGDAVPPLPGLFSSFNSRPIMAPDGTAYWVGGTATTPTGTTSNRHLFKATDVSNPSSITRILGGGDVIDGKTINPGASNFDFDLSDNGLHHIHMLDMQTGSSTNNDHVYVDGAFVAQEGSPTGQGDNWSGLDSVGINNGGNYVFTGDTDGATATDEFLAYNGNIEVREGDTLNGTLIPSGATFRAISINNLNELVHMWGTSAVEHLFFGVGGSLSASLRLLSTGDLIDVNSDTIGDYTVTDFNGSTTIGPGLDLAEDGKVYVHVDIEPVGGGTAVQAVICIAVPEPATLSLVALGLAFAARRRRRV